MSGGISIETASCNHHITSILNHERGSDYTILRGLRDGLKHLPKRLLCLLIGCFVGRTIGRYVNTSDSISSGERHHSMESPIRLEDNGHSLIQRGSAPNDIGELIAYLIDQFPHEKRSRL